MAAEPNAETKKIMEMLKNSENFNIDSFKEAITIDDVDEEHRIDYLYQDKNSKNTLMHYAAKLPISCRLRVFKILCEHGSELNGKDKNDKTPLDLMNEKDSPKAVSYLKAQIEKQEDTKKKKAEEEAWLKSITGKIEAEIKAQCTIPPGIHFTPTLTLFYLGKYHNRRCEIPDKWTELDKQQDCIENLTLHQRLAISEAFVTSRAHDTESLLESSTPSRKSVNYVTANIGFVVSTKAWKFRKEGEYRTTFITIPVDNSAYDIYRPRENNSGTHAEKVFYEYISNIYAQRKIACILTEKLLNEFNSFEGHKIYALIIDIHSSHDMCTDCEEKTYAIQRDRADNSFLRKFEHILENEFKFILPKEKNFSSNLLLPKIKRLSCVTRVSSYLKYDRGVQPSQKVGNYSYFYKDFNAMSDIKLIDNENGYALPGWYDSLSNSYCLIREYDDKGKIVWHFIYKNYDMKAKKIDITGKFREFLNELQNDKMLKDLTREQKKSISDFIQNYWKQTQPVNPEIDRATQRNVKEFGCSVILHTSANSRSKYYFYGEDADKYKGLIDSKNKYAKTSIAVSRQTVFSTTNTQNSPHQKESPKIEIKFP